MVFMVLWSVMCVMSVYEDVVWMMFGVFVCVFDVKWCDVMFEGVWKFDVVWSELFGLFLCVFGVLWIVMLIVDNLLMMVMVKCDDDGCGFVIVDVMVLSLRNEMCVWFDGVEMLWMMWGGWKWFYLLGDVWEGVLVIVCWLFECGEGWVME